MTTFHNPADQRLTTRLLLAGGALGPPLFITGYLVNGALRPGYSTWRHTISTLSLGDHGWTQIASFMLYGLLTLCFATGLGHTLPNGPGTRWAPALFLTTGLGLVAIGPFVTDPILGYPPATPTTTSLSGAIHNLTSLIVFLAFPAGCLVMARRFTHAGRRGWAVYSTATGVLAITFVMLYFTAVSTTDSPDGATSPAGLLERVPTIILGLWQTLLALRLLRAGQVGEAIVEP